MAIKLSIIVPVYNEERTIRAVIERLLAVPLEKEIIVVNDGSGDGTAEILAGIEHPRLVKVAHPVNRGKGAAIRTGRERARGELVIIQDADLEYDPADYSRLIRSLEEKRANVVYGSRFLGGRNAVFNPYYLANRFLTGMTNLLYGSALTDMETCYKLFRRETFAQVAIRAKRFDVEPEITAQLLRRGEKIVEVPIAYARRGRREGKKIGLKDGFAAVATLWKYRFARMDLIRPGEKIKVLHVITRMIVGGAQENTLFTMERLGKDDRFEALLATGPALGPEGSLIGELEKKGVRSVLIPELRREVNPFLDVIALVKLYRLLRRGRFSVVHTHSAKAGILGRAAARLAGTPVIVHTVHGLPFHPYQNRLLNFLYFRMELLARNWCDLFVCVGEAMAKELVRTGISPPEKIRVVHSGIELEKYRQAAPDREWQARLGPAGDAPVVGKIARLFHLKGHEHLFAAAVAVKRDFPGVKFLLVGDGILKPKLEARARKLGIAGNVFFTGLVPPERIPALISLMDVVVHVSFREGLPRAVVQGFALGRPAVAFAVDGAPEVVLEGKTGHLVPPGDTEGLAAGIVDLLRNREKARAWGREGKRLVEEKFDAEKMGGQIIALYLELLEKYR